MYKRVCPSQVSLGLCGCDGLGSQMSAMALSHFLPLLLCVEEYVDVNITLTYIGLLILQ